MPLKHGSSPSPGSHGIITLLTDNRLESFLQSSVSFAEQTLSGNHQTVRTYEFHSPWPMNSTPSRLLSPTISNLTRSSSIPYYKKYTRNVVPPIPLSLRVVCEQQSWERSRRLAAATAAIGQRAIRFDKYNNKWLRGGRRDGGKKRR